MSHVTILQSSNNNINKINLNDNLDIVFRKWCAQLSSGRVYSEIRKFAVYILWYRCELKQYHIALLLGVSTRTIRRDMRVIEKQMFY